METWYSLEVGDGIEAYRPTGKIEKLFVPFFISSGSPKDMAVFESSQSDALGLKTYTIYFTPSTEKVAKALGATPCPKPTLTHVARLGGAPDALDIFFPDRIEEI